MHNDIRTLIRNGLKIKIFSISNNLMKQVHKNIINKLMNYNCTKCQKFQHHKFAVEIIEKN